MPPAAVGKNNKRSVWWYSYWPINGENFCLKPYKFKVGDNVSHLLKRNFRQGVRFQMVG